MKIKIIFIYLCFIIVPQIIFAQNDTLENTSFRVELGLGGGSTGGLSGRAAFIYTELGWGGTMRITAHDGKKGVSGSWFGPPIEKFIDVAAMVSRSIHPNEEFEYILSAGVGALSGEKLTESKSDLEKFNYKLGFAYEVGVATIAGTVGLSFGIIGNINTERTFNAFIISINFGDKW